MTTILHDNLKKLLEYPQYEAMNTAIIKYVYYNLPDPQKTKLFEDPAIQSAISSHDEDDKKKYQRYQNYIQMKQEELIEHPELTNKEDNINRNADYWQTVENIDDIIKSDEILINPDEDPADVSSVLIIEDGNKPEILQWDDPNEYRYSEKLLLKVKEYIDEGINLLKANGDKNKVDKETQMKRIYQDIQSKLYLIKPNPTSELTFIVYEDEDINLFMEYNESRRNKKILKQHYNKFDKLFKSFYPYNKFINKLDYYKEKTRSSYNVLFKDGYIFDYENLQITSTSADLPSVKSELKLERLTNTQKRLLDTYFTKMYTSQDKLKKFLLYVLANFNKDYVKQSIFINVDNSGVGKTARILPMLELGYNANADSNVLKETERYNIANYNMLIVNEADKKRVDGSALSDIADNSPKYYTQKGKDMLRVNPEDKPLLTIIGENLPLLEKLNDGTTRRFLLIPPVCESYRQLVADIEKIRNGTITDEAKIKKYDMESYKQFYTLLYEYPMQVIQYYLLKIRQFNLTEDAEIIAKDMKITLEDLTKLLTTNEDIFNKFFVAEPTAKDDIPPIDGRIIIGKQNSLNKLLDIINKDYIKTDHYRNTTEAKRALNQWLKENNELKNLKDYGRTTISENKHTEEAYYIYQLNNYALKPIEEYNKTVKNDSEKIYYQREYPKDEP